MLDQLENLGANIVIDRSWADGLEQRDKIVHEFFGGDLGKEMLTTILDASICELQGKSVPQISQSNTCAPALWQHAGEHVFAGPTYV